MRLKKVNVQKPLLPLSQNFLIIIAKTLASTYLRYLHFKID